MCHSIIDCCKRYAQKGSCLQQLWRSHFGGLLFGSPPWRPTDQLEREHSVEPLNHPSEELASIQSSVVVLENK